MAQEIPMATHIVESLRKRHFPEQALRIMTREAGVPCYRPPSWRSRGDPQAFDRGLRELATALRGRSPRFYRALAAYERDCKRLGVGTPPRDQYLSVSLPPPRRKTAAAGPPAKVPVMAHHLFCADEYPEWQAFWNRCGRSVEGCIDYIKSSRPVRDKRAFCSELARYLNGTYTPISALAATESRYREGQQPTHEFGKYLMQVRASHRDSPQPRAYYRSLGTNYQQFLDVLGGAMTRPDPDEAVRYLSARVADLGHKLYSDYVRRAVLYGEENV